jgi:O-antigen ligase
LVAFIPKGPVLAGVAVWLATPSFDERTFGGTSTLASNPIVGILGQANLSGRVLLWADVWNSLVVGAEPWGHGLGSTNAFLASRYEVIRLVHNEYLRLLAEAGLIGLAGFLWAYGVPLGRAARLALSRTAASPDAALAAGAITTFLVASLAENTFELFAIYSIFPWVFLGAALGRKADQ